MQQKCSYQIYLDKCECSLSFFQRTGLGMRGLHPQLLTSYIYTSNKALDYCHIVWENRLMYIKNGIVDERECGMKDIWWKIKEISREIRLSMDSMILLTISTGMFLIVLMTRSLTSS